MNRGETTSNDRDFGGSGILARESLEELVYTGKTGFNLPVPPVSLAILHIAPNYSK